MPPLRPLFNSARDIAPGRTAQRPGARRESAQTGAVRFLAAVYARPQLDRRPSRSGHAGASP